MRVVSPRLLMLLCVCLLAMQVSGLHLHASHHGSSEVHGTHIHPADVDGHSNESGTDIGYLAYVIGWMKPIPFLLLFITPLILVVEHSRQVWAPITKTFHPYCYSHWRPPLRAPPSPLY